MGAYLEFQDMLLDRFEQAELEALTVHDYVDTEQLGRRWDFLCRHHRHTAGNEDIVTSVSVRLNSPLEVLLEEAQALDWEPGEDVNQDNNADGELEVEIRLAGSLVGEDARTLWDVLQSTVPKSGVFDQMALVREERLETGGKLGEVEGGSTVHLRFASYPEPQDFCREGFWAAVAKVLADTLDLFYRQFPEGEVEGEPF